MLMKCRTAFRRLAITLCAAGIAGALASVAAAHTRHIDSQHTISFQPDVASDVFFGTVGSAAGACERNRSITLFRKIGDASVPDIAVATPTTNENGIWSQGLGNAPEGRYYAVAAKKVIKRPGHKHICDVARSNTVAVEADQDSDGVSNAEDNCPTDANTAQEDADTDGKGDACDACPAVPNPGSQACPPPDVPDACRLQSPAVAEVQTGATVTVYGRVFEEGITDQSTANDPSIVSQVGYGPDGTNPETASGWTFAASAPNAAYGEGSPGFEATFDEHVGSFTAPAPGTYDFAYRFSLDGGTTYLYCDGGAAGSSDGYNPANAGQLTAVAP
jgi:hypothetical protein